MKQLLVIVGITSFLDFSCTGQRITEAKVPSVVVNTLKTKYPTAEKADWRKSNDLYEAEIDVAKDNELTVRIDATGNLLMQKQDILQDDLLPVIQSFIDEKYSGYTIDDMHKIDNNGTIYYQVDLDARRKNDVKLVFTADGREERSIAYWD